VVSQESLLRSFADLTMRRQMFGQLFSGENWPFAEETIMFHFWHP
jgi:hypothetical protein